MIKPTDPNLPHIDRLEDEVTAYLRMRTDSVKLSVVEGLSTVIGKGLALVIVIVLCSIALLAFSVVLALLVGEWLGSMVWGAVVVGGFYLLVALLIWLMRVKFVDKMVGMFARMIFAPSKDDRP